ncbi:hypothetical protein CL656_06085, partial [bacterium]|nr:hypothetical protein [bacterium]
ALNEIDLDLNKYNLEDVLKILDIDIKTIINDDESEIKEKITKRLDDLIIKFNNLRLNKFVSFFENIKDNFVEKFNNEDIINSQEQLVISSNNIFDAEKNYNYINNNSTDTTDKSLYTQNINPINRKTVQKVINIDSKFRKNYDSTLSTNFRFDLPTKITNVIEMKLNDLELINTYYVISNDYDNNYFWAKITTNYGSYMYVFFFVDPQSYYEEDLITFINERFISIGIAINFKIDLTYQNSGGVPDGTGKLIITISDSRFSNIEFQFQSSSIPNFIDSYSYNNYFNKRQFVYTTNLIGRILPPDGLNQSQIEDLEEERGQLFESDISSDTQFNVNDGYTNEYLISLYNTKDTRPLSHKLGWMFGFRNATIVTDLVGDQNSKIGEIKGEAVINFLGARYFYLDINDYNNNYNSTFITSDENNIVKPNTFARINQRGAPFSITPNSSYQITTIPRYYFGPVDIEKMEIKIYDEYGDILNLNGSDVSLTLILTCIYSS